MMEIKIKVDTAKALSECGNSSALVWKIVPNANLICIFIAVFLERKDNETGRQVGEFYSNFDHMWDDSAEMTELKNRVKAFSQGQEDARQWNCLEVSNPRMDGDEIVVDLKFDDNNPSEKGDVYLPFK